MGITFHSKVRFTAKPCRLLPWSTSLYLLRTYGSTSTASSRRSTTRSHTDTWFIALIFVSYSTASDTKSCLVFP
jgi:hypothetical protein